MTTPDELDNRSLEVIGKNLYQARQYLRQPTPPGERHALEVLLIAVDDMYALLCTHFEHPTPEEQETN